MALFDYIKYIKSPVNMKCFGRVRSMGTIILQACNKRYLSKNCLFLIHYGTSTQGETHTKDHIKFAKQLEKENAKMEDIYLKRIKEKHPSYKKESLQNLMKYDKYMSPKEAINLGMTIDGYYGIPFNDVTKITNKNIKLHLDRIHSLC